MKHLLFARFFEAEGAGGGASPKEGAGDPPDENDDLTDGGEAGTSAVSTSPKDRTDGGGAASARKAEPEKPSGEDISGLKSALEKERKARKELVQQIKELREIKDRASEDEKKLQEYQAKLAEYEFRDRRDAALDSAIAGATKDGKFSVDRGKAGKLAGKLGNADTLEADVAEIVDLLKAPVEEPKRKEPVMRGQPSGTGSRVTTDLPHHEWAKLRKTDPEAYEAMLRARRQKGPFRIMGS